jgi:hypothetical protein
MNERSNAKNIALISEHRVACFSTRNPSCVRCQKATGTSRLDWTLTMAIIAPKQMYNNPEINKAFPKRSFVLCFGFS